MTSITEVAPESSPEDSRGDPVIVRVDRSMLGSRRASPLFEGGPTGEEVVEVFDLHALPDGHPFVIGLGASLVGTEHLNRYFLAARRSNAYEPDSLSKFHAGKLVLFLRFLWRRHGKPVELSEATTSDLVAYKEERRATISSSTWDTELSCLGAFFHWALAGKLIDVDPMPRWGTRQRNTLRDRLEDRRTPKFLQERELRFFLYVGLRGDQVYENRPLPYLGPAFRAPAGPCRDFLLGFLEVTTGMRREEAIGVLDIELPSRIDDSVPRPLMASGGVHRFLRYGKLGKARWIYITDAVIDAVDEYRTGERERAVTSAQDGLKTNLSDHLVVNDVRVHTGKPQVHLESGWKNAELLSDEDRRRAVRITEDGRIEPLGLIVSRRGLPPAIDYSNELYSDGNRRVAVIDHPDRPSIRVSNHTMRHTFAVRTLAALIQASRRNEGDPYALVMNPVFVVQELLGHSDPETTNKYLYAAERYEVVPDVLRAGAERIAHDLKESPEVD